MHQFPKTYFDPSTHTIVNIIARRMIFAGDSLDWTYKIGNLVGSPLQLGIGRTICEYFAWLANYKHTFTSHI